MDYKTIDYAVLHARNAHLSYEEIEMRQLAELHQLVEKWQQGLSIWEVGWQLSYIMDVWAFGPFSDVVEKTSGYPTPEVIAKARDKLRPYMRPDFLEDSVTNNVKESIADFAKQIEERDDLTSFEFARTIARAILLDVEEIPQLKNFLDKHPDEYIRRFLNPGAFPNPRPYFANWDTPLDFLLAKLGDEEARNLQRKNRKIIVGSLQSEPEEQILTRLDPYIEKMREGWSYEGFPKLIKNMTIDASGSGQIKPYAYNPNYLPKNLANPEGVFFDPYGRDDPDEPSYKENIYGTTISYITTYSIAFEPKSPEQLEELAAKIRKALKIIGVLPPSFALPTDADATPYKRPFHPARDVNEIVDEEKPKLTSTSATEPAPLTPEQEKKRLEELIKAIENAGLGEPTNYWPRGAPKAIYISSEAATQYCDVVMQDGSRVMINTRLDLDDTYALYYLLEHYIEPSAEIARALNAARFIEARSAPQEKMGLRSPYSVDAISPSKRLGHLANSAPNAVLAKALEASQTLYFGGQIDDKCLLEQIMAIAAQTLDGNLVDPSGVFPSHQLLLANPKNANIPITMQQALRDRTKQFLNLVAGLQPDSDQPTIAALYQSAAHMTDDVRKKWRSELEEQFKTMRASALKSSGFTIEDWFNRRKNEGNALQISDLISGYAKRIQQEEALFGTDAFKPENADEYARRTAAEEILHKKARQDNPNILERDAARLFLKNERIQEEARQAAREAYERAQKAIPTFRTGLVVRAPDVPACADRVYQGTVYTSRLTGSAWVRKELPSALREFISPESDPHRTAKNVLIGFTENLKPTPLG